MEYQEFSGKSLENTISEAAKTFGVDPENLEYEIVNMGSAGFLGFNSKPTVIKAKVKSEYLKKQEDQKREESKQETINKAEVSKEYSKPATNVEKDFSLNAEKTREDKPIKYDEKPEKEKFGDNDYYAQKKGGERRPYRNRERRENIKPVVVDEEKLFNIINNFLGNVFSAMKMNVNVNSSYSQNDACVTVDLSGEDMGILIGKRGQTLDALQYLVSLIVNKEMDEYIRVKVDTEDYRSRRQKTLENLAKNLAYKVKRTKRPVSLEPMNPYERRIIHSALQGDRYVTTYSEGDEPFRRVVITLKRG